MNELGSESHPLDRNIIVRVNIPELTGENKVNQMAPEQEASGPSTFLTLQEDYLFWGPSLLRSFPSIERWASADARLFERGLLYRFRLLVRQVYVKAEKSMALEKLEIEWIWDELMRRKLDTEVFRILAQMGLDKKFFLSERATNQIASLSFWTPLRGTGQILLIFFAMGWGVYFTYWFLRLVPVTELWTRLFSFAN